MSSSFNIQYLSHKDIDKKKWDKCIINASNNLIYARSLYLDIMAKNWDALVMFKGLLPENDYEAVMPLTWNKKYGFYYLYQPFFTASLGIFGEDLHADLVRQFLVAIPKKFIYWDIDMNEQNLLGDHSMNKKIHPAKRINIFLPLNKNYEQIAAGYSRLAKRKLINSAQYEVVVNKNIDPAIVIEQYSVHYEKTNGAIPKKGYNQLSDLVAVLPKDNYRAYSAILPGNEIAAFYLVYTDEKFIYSIIGGSTENGKNAGAFYLLTDAVIREFAGSNKIFRFEGSDIPGIAFFDMQFGSYKVEYWHLKMNDLPWPVNLLKK